MWYTMQYFLHGYTEFNFKCPDIWQLHCLHTFDFVAVILKPYQIYDWPLKTLNLNLIWIQFFLSKFKIKTIQFYNWVSVKMVAAGCCI